jgi:KaiC/GvpD/RAD55 family RecA-like ATPase
MVRCPAHDDRSPSLSVEHKGDRTLIHCFAGCEAERVLEKLGLGFTDLYDERNRSGNGRLPVAKAPKGRGNVASGNSLSKAESAPGYNTRKFRVLDVAKMVSEQPPEVPWQIHGLVVRGDVTILTGDPGAGKSLLALTLAAAVARGELIAGLECERGSVVYLDAENGGREIHRRIRSLGVPDVDVTVVEADGVNLRDEVDFAGLESVVAQFEPSMLVLDSLTALWPGANERKTEDVAPTLYELKRLAERHGTAILVLHHRPKDGGEYRGTTAIAAAAQLGFTLAKAKDDPDRTRRRLRCWKCRPAPEPEDRWLHLDAERGMVLVGEAEPFESLEEPEVQAPARQALTPRVLEALGGGPLSLTEIAVRVGKRPADGTLRRVADHLAASGEIVRRDDKKYEKCKVSGVSGPKGSDTVTADTSHSKAESGMGLVEGVCSIHEGAAPVATPGEEAEAERVRRKFADPGEGVEDLWPDQPFTRFLKEQEGIE